MRTPFLISIITATVLILFSCGGRNDSGPADPAAKDTLATSQPQPDSTLAPVKQQIENGLGEWIRSFNGFNIDSFRRYQKSNFEQEDNDETNDLAGFYELYKPSLSFSPDSSQFIDLYSSGLFLEKKGKKIIASSDVDQAITLCNLKTKEWKRIAFFGPSAAIEEAVWVSPSRFILAGTIFNDDNQRTALIMLGDAAAKSFQWFESAIIRPESSEYEASGLKKLKIDEWE